ncbi:ribonuclease E inhibitor RraB [Sphingomonas sp. ERG5]|uniref:ribonuclease E inhibitor RraB n=1 Tax=Sphingomonas sp. ERG5 TaxID=1381597 RepID=UPI00069033CA|nr:ribonuclease E inhibitor RraB [Sphingomonas sp. ERG5]
MYPFLLLLFAQATATSSRPVDFGRIEAEMAADADVLKSLERNGDDPTIKRPVDVRFVGQVGNIVKLQNEIGALGWRVVQRVPVDGGEMALDVQTDQTTDRAAIRNLTEAALSVEEKYGVRYDGWGTVATKP